MKKKSVVVFLLFLFLLSCSSVFGEYIINYPDNDASYFTVSYFDYFELNSKGNIISDGLALELRIGYLTIPDAVSLVIGFYNNDSGEFYHLYDSEEVLDPDNYLIGLPDFALDVNVDNTLHHFTIGSNDTFLTTSVNSEALSFISDCIFLGKTIDCKVYIYGDVYSFTIRGNDEISGAIGKIVSEYSTPDFWSITNSSGRIYAKTKRMADNSNDVAVEISASGNPGSITRRIDSLSLQMYKSPKNALWHECSNDLRSVKVSFDGAAPVDLNCSIGFFGCFVEEDGIKMLIDMMNQSDETVFLLTDNNGYISIFAFRSEELLKYFEYPYRFAY